LLRGHALTGVTRLLLKTRNSAGWVEDSTLFREDFVGLSLDAAAHLVALGVRLVGVDGLSVAPFRGGDGVHEALLEPRIILVEGLALADVPAGDYDLLCAPMKLAGSDGAPARVFLRDAGR
jgi:arylformamidase